MTTPTIPIEFVNLLRQPKPLAEKVCVTCPSAGKVERLDPLVQEVLVSRRRRQLEMVPVCGWDYGLCRGYCLRIDITEEEIWEVNEMRRLK